MEPLGITEWIACLVIGAGTLVVGFVLRLWPMPEAVDTALYNVDIQAAGAEAKMLKKAKKDEKKKLKGDKKH